MPLSPDPPSPDPAVLLAHLSDLYQRQLHGDDPQGRELLRKFGLSSKDTLDAFRIGFSDGKLPLRTNAQQRPVLQLLGMLTHNQLEWTSNALIVPAFDPTTGAVVDLHAMREYRNAKVNLFDPPRGLIHPAALKAEELILTDWMEAALKIHQAGWRAVLPVRGPGDITVHLDAFKEARVKVVWIASPKRGDALAAALKPLGCELRRLSLHHDYRAIDADTLKRQMGSAEHLQAARPRPAFVEAGDDHATFERHGLLFRLEDLNENLKAVLSLSKKEGATLHTDRVDLLSASSRRRFSKDAASRTGLEAEALEAVLLDLVDEARKVLVDRQREQAAAPLLVPEDRKAAALEALRVPELVERIVEDIARLGLVGERENALLLFLVAVSRKLTKPLSAILRSESASGKSNLVERIIELLPEEDVVYVSRMSANALFFMPPGSLEHRLLVVEERDGSTEADYAVRILQSKGHLTTAIPLPPEQPGLMRTKLVTVKGPVAYIETSTAPEIDVQNLNRCVEVRLDESPQQTARIIEERHRRRSSTHERASREGIVQRHRDMQRLLSPVTVLIPFAKHLTFPAAQVRFRRDHERLLGLIDASTLLHQHQREWRTTPRGERVVIATLEDYAVAHRLSARALALAVDEVSATARAAWEAVAGFQGRSFTRRELMKVLNWPYWKTFAALRELRSHDLLAVEPSAGQKPATYTALSSSPTRPDLGLLSPETLARLLSDAVEDGPTT